MWNLLKSEFDSAHLNLNVATLSGSLNSDDVLEALRVGDTGGYDVVFSNFMYDVEVHSKILDACPHVTVYFERKVF